jgi:hypothetical protein
VTAFLVILVCSLSAARAQTPSYEVFAPIPEGERARLVQRLNLLVEYQRTKQWAKQYDLLASLLTRAESKRDFVSRTRQAYTRWGRTPLLAFTPYKVASVQVDAGRKAWFIYGCSQVLEKGQKVSQFAFVEAYKERNDWFFSELQGVGASKDSDPCALAPATKSF